MKHLKQSVWLAVILFLLGGWCHRVAAPAQAQSIQVPEKAAPAMLVDDVRIGMKGYGMTVFHGTEPEPFAVEVVSIVPNSQPTRSVIWVRCPDPRMQQSGPVQGMSGSPIYLWDEDEPQVLGKGGKLIGAFAFGYPNSQVCMVGVQPIEYMRESATRITDEDAQASGSHRTGNRHAGRVVELLERMDELAEREGLSPLTRERNALMLELMRRATGQEAGTGEDGRSRDRVAGPMADGRMATAMRLPISLGSPRAVSMFGPLLEPLGFAAVAADAGPIGGTPPKSIDVEATDIKPGSVLAVPLLYGDLDLSASGTVTDVLPGGEVLGFGHPMFGLGTAQVPLATGYVHFVMPLRTISFKNGGSLTPVGTLVRDESAAVVGISEVRYTTAPIDVTVNMPDDISRSYHYELVNEPSLSPMLASLAAMNSMSAVHGVHPESTIRIRAELTFTGGREFKVDSLLAGGNAGGAVSEIMPPMAVMVQNPYESLDIESVNVTLDVEHGIRSAQIVGGRLLRSEVTPGGSAEVLLEMQHYAGETETRKLVFDLPEDLPEGDYVVSISGASNFVSTKMMSRPHLMVTKSVDDLLAFIQESASYPSDAIYVSMQLPDVELAVGRTEMPALPSSRAAMLTSPTTTDTMPYSPVHDQMYEADAVIVGQVNFTLNVRKP